MKALITLLMISVALSASLSAQSPGPGNSDQAATESLKSLEEMIARGEVGWWKSEADPTIQFLNKYSGLGGDTVTALSLNQAEQLWPAWKSVGGGLEKFGIACSVYSCLKSTAEGNYNAAVLNALKDFLKYRLSKMSNAVASSAAGVGLIDFALNSFGEAALQQIADDYWFIYCRYQIQRHPALHDYVKLITEGDGTRRGFDAVVASLDSFWDDPATAGIRGYAALQTQDPNYRATFRSRYLKENLLPFLLAWAEREREREQVAAWVALQRLTEQLQTTKVVVDFALLDQGLNEPPAAATIELVVEFYGSKPETRVLARGAAAARNRLEFPLASAIGPDRRLARTLQLRLHCGGADAARKPSPERFEVAWINPAGPWNRVVKPGQIEYVAKKPFYTSEWSECQVALTGEGANEVSSVMFRRLPTGTTTNLRELASATGYASATLQNGQGKTRLSHGLYLVSCEDGIHVFTHGPVKIGGATTLTIPVRTARVETPSAPSVNSYREIFGQAASATRERQPNQREVLEATGRSLQDYWVATYTALNGYLAAARALEKQRNAETSATSLTYEQRKAIDEKFRPQIRAMEEAKEATQKAIWDSTREEEKVADEIAAAARVRHEAARKELSAAGDALNQGLSALRQQIQPAGSDFEQLAGFLGGRLQNMPTAEMDAALAEMKRLIGKLETEVPTLLASADALPPLQTRYNAAVAVTQDIEITEGQTIYFNPTNYDAEIASLLLKTDAIRNNGYVEAARQLVQRAEQIVQARQERGRRAAAIRQELETLAGQLPVVDAGRWRERGAAFRAQAEPLWAACDAAGDEDAAAWRKLDGELTAFLGEQSAVCGDVLEGERRKENAFTAFQQKFEEFTALQLWREVTPDFWKTMNELAWPRVRARDAATAEVLALAADVRRWLASGATRAMRVAALQKARAEFRPEQSASDAGARLARIGALEARMRTMPARLLQAERETWQAERLQLVRSGDLDRWLAAQSRPYVRFTFFNETPAQRAFYWPEKPEQTNPQTQQGMPVALDVANLPDGSMYLLQESTDGGKTWRGTVSWGRKWRSYLQWQGTEHRFRALLPDGSVTAELPAFPQYLPPLGPTAG
jgi:hypothetical protein